MKKIPTLESLREEQERARESDALAEDSVDVADAGLIEDDVVTSEPDSAPMRDEAEDAQDKPRRRKRTTVSPTKQRQRRRYARERAVQALYQWDVGASSASEVRRYFLEQQDMSRADIEYFEEAFRGVTTNPEPIDAIVTAELDRGFEELDPVERAILRLGVWELRERLDMPIGVVISEAVEVSKRFGAEQGHRYVNGVLDAVGKRLRASEPRRDTGA